MELFRWPQLRRRKESIFEGSDSFFSFPSVTFVLLPLETYITDSCYIRLDTHRVMKSSQVGVAALAMAAAGVAQASEHVERTPFKVSSTTRGSDDGRWPFLRGSSSLTCSSVSRTTADISFTLFLSFLPPAHYRLWPLCRTIHRRLVATLDTFCCHQEAIWWRAILLRRKVVCRGTRSLPRSIRRQGSRS